MLVRILTLLRLKRFARMWQPVCQLDELQEGKGKYVEVGRHALALYLHEGRVFALDNTCPHAGANLAGGWLDGDCVVCPKHCWPFKLETGELRGAPHVTVDTFRVRVRNGPGEGKQVEVQVPL